MNETIIIAFALVFLASIVLMIPAIMYNKKIKKRAEDYIAENTGKAILTIYGTASSIDGVSMKSLNYNRNNGIALEPGKHTLNAKYSILSQGLGSSKTYKMKKPVETVLNLEADCEYDIALYFYSSEQRRAYYKGEVGETIYEEKFSASGKDVYLICYKEKRFGEQVFAS